MTDSPSFPRDLTSSFLSPTARGLLLPMLAQISWADGHVSLAERSAARGAALAVGAVDPMDRRCASLLPRDAAVDASGLAALPTLERQLLVACAAWLALADGVETPSETAALYRLATAAKLSRAAATRLAGTARWIRAYAPARLTWRQEADRLLRTCAAHSTVGSALGGVA